MISTQAKQTKKYLVNANKIIVESVKKGSLDSLHNKIHNELSKIPGKASELVGQVAEYEAEYTFKKIKKNASRQRKNSIYPLSEQQINVIISSEIINTSINGAKRTVASAYQQFAENKVRQYMQIISDAELEEWDEDEIEDAVSEKTNGLFTTQNLALAGLALLAVAGNVRNEVAKENNMRVEWVLDLELNNCSYCEDMANDGPYDPEDVEGEIPVHSNCGCALIPIEED